MRTDTRFRVREFVAHHDTINSVHVGPSSAQVVVSGGDDKMINLWRVDRTVSLLNLSNGNSAVDTVRFDPTERTVVAGSRSGSIKLFSLGAHGKMKCRLQGHRSSCTAIDFHPFGDFLISGSLDTNIKIWDVRHKSCIKTFKEHQEKVNCVQFSPDGKWFASGGDDGIVNVWDLAASKLLHSFTTHRGPITALRFHPNEFLLATGSQDRTVKFWDLETFEHVGTTPIDTSAISTMEFASNSETENKGRVVVASNEGMKVWSWEPCRCISQLDSSWGSGKSMAVTSVNSAELAIVCSFKKSSLSLWSVPIEQDIEPKQTSTSFEEGGGDIIKVSNRPILHTTQHQLEFSDDSSVEENIVVESEDQKITDRKVSVVKSSNSDHAGQNESGEMNDYVNREVYRSESKETLLNECKPLTQARAVGRKLSLANCESNTKQFSLRRRNTQETLQSDKPGQSNLAIGDTKCLRPSTTMNTTSPAEEKQVEKDNGSVVSVIEGKLESMLIQDTKAHQDSVVPAQHDEPLGLSFTKFMPSRKQQPAVDTFHENVTKASNDIRFRIEVAQTLTQGHQRFSTVLSARLIELKHLKLLWQQGNTNQVFLNLAELQDSCITADFLQAANLAAAGLTLSQCDVLLDLIVSSFTANFESQIWAGISSLEKMISLFGDLIRSTVDAKKLGGVNVAQEERFEQCKVIQRKLSVVVDALDVIIGSKKWEGVGGTLTPLMRRSEELKELIKDIL